MVPTMTIVIEHGMQAPVATPRPCLRTRPLAPGDRAAFVAAFERLSPDSRYRRFGTPKPRLTEAEIRCLVEVDHHDHEAIVGFECASGAPVGVARFVRLGDRPDTAEVAVTVMDGWQGLGIGTRLVRHVAERAAAE